MKVHEDEKGVGQEDREHIQGHACFQNNDIGLLYKFINVCL